MNHPIRIRATIGLVAAVGLAGLAAGPASAVPASTTATTATATRGQGDAAQLQAIKVQAATAITQRIAALNQLTATLQASTYLGADQATLVASDQAAVSGLNQLNTTIAADTTVLAARVHADLISSQFRIYALVIPAGHMVRAADAITNVAVPKLTSLATTIQGLLTPANSSSLQPLLTDMINQTHAAAHDVTGLGGQLEGYSPSQWNTNHQLLSPALSAIRAARTALAQATKDAHILVGDLLHPNGGQK